MSWSELFGEALAGSDGHRVERIAVRPGEVTARVGGHETSLIRTEWPEQEWVRVCAALASQPVFRARVLGGELPEAAARVFALLGLDLVPRGWGGLVATCSCDHWAGRCAHLSATAAALGTEADRDPFVLTRWAGRERRPLVELVRDLSTGTMGPSAREAAFGNDDHTGLSPEHEDTPDRVFAPEARTTGPLSAAAFWAEPSPPPPPPLPEGVADRVRAAAPGHVADELPGFDRSGMPFPAREGRL
ncbi:SWIM zinc finger family protein [Nocardiopsis nanhaiensis]